MTHHIRKASATFAGLGLAGLLAAGCAVTPDYQKPALTIPEAFRGQPAAPATAVSVADIPWTEMFQDPTLQALITEGLANNQDLQVAVARIERARALVGVARSESQPQLNYRAGAGAENTFVPDSNSIGTAEFATIGGALEAAWEFDVWGRIRRTTEAAQANLLAQEDIRRGVLLTLVSDIATGYFRLLELDREVAIARDSERVYSSTLDLFTRRFEAGRDSRLPVERARANYRSSNARVEDLARQIALEENALSVLMGGYPKAIARGRPLLGQGLPATPLGSTTALLQRRPDILAAEQRLIQANAEIGVAIANKFPRIGLSALAGGLSAGDDDNFEGFGVWNLALGAAGPIFTGGRLESIEKERRAHWDEVVAEYRKAVLVAFREVSDAMAAQDTLARRRTHLEGQVAALRHSVELAQIRYDSGRASYFEVLETQQQLFPAEDALAQVQRDQLVAVVALYKALGGGWRQAGEATPPAS